MDSNTLEIKVISAGSSLTIDVQEGMTVQQALYQHGISTENANLSLATESGDQVKVSANDPVQLGVYIVTKGVTNG